MNSSVKGSDTFQEASPGKPGATHPLGCRAKVLLSSIFGPYGEDDDYGSRAINPMELYENQVTRVQGPFSLRMFHRSWGLMLIQVNISAPCTVLDFPTRERFIDELSNHQYDIIGISAIAPNIGKVEEMCALIRKHQPSATIVLGGHEAGLPDLAQRTGADHVALGDGVEWFRRFLGEDPGRAIRHPLISSGYGRRTMGISIPFPKGRDVAVLIPSVGCPIGCNFCSTSAMFGGKGKQVNFYHTGEELFDIMCKIEKEMNVQTFFVMDENFLLQRPRALRLLELMKEHDKVWTLYVFSSANAIKSYTMEQLVELGISWVWMGLEGRDSKYGKLNDTDTRQLVRTLQSHGIRVMGSTIIGMEEHTPENLDEAIDSAVSHDTEFHQFMLYTPVPGTPLYAELSAQGRIIGPDAIADADVHGQYRFNYRHLNLPAGSETDYLLRAFRRDYEANGPSVLRVVRSTLEGWRRYRNHPQPRIRRRFAMGEIENMATLFAPALWAARWWFRGNPAVVAKMEAMLEDVYREFGIKARIFSIALGPVVLFLLRREARRLAGGWKYEPPTFYTRNYELDVSSRRGNDLPTLARWVVAG